eukprot:gnl/Ergobibamus_cyprinoides/561.p2 GENE.gnl/Ergobibamus_cyprinoides/561~~gnl/Ergobibamus_cyprinoides/561.p2  ORF type:complete len:391 (-),score=138.15 gnl/Ergobibamus_cyprinoides/561:58-1098(-)
MSHLDAEGELCLDGLGRKIWPYFAAQVCAGTPPFDSHMARVRRFWGLAPYRPNDVGVKCHKAVIRDSAKVRCYNGFYAATEGFFGTSYSWVHPFYQPDLTSLIEFIPLPDQPRPEKAETVGGTLLSHQVVIGNTYELVCTSHNGKYRYRPADHVRIEGFYGGIFRSLPLFSVDSRTSDILNIGGEKCGAKRLGDCIQAAAAEAPELFRLPDGTPLIDEHFDRALWTVLQNDDQMRYEVFVECQNFVSDDLTVVAPVAQEAVELVHDKLARKNANGGFDEIYGLHVNNGKIRKLRIWAVPHGFMNHAFEAQVAGGAVAQQAKIPRVTRLSTTLGGLLASKVPASSGH